MSIRRARRQFRKLRAVKGGRPRRRRLRRLWAWHHAQLQMHPTYARAVAKGVMEALWSHSPEKLLATAARALIEICIALRGGAMRPGDGAFA